MLQNVLSFFTNHQPYFQMALGVWQILKFTLPAALIKGLMRRLLSFLLPGFFPAYKQLRHCPGCLFKTVKCVLLTEGQSQSKSKRRSDRINYAPEKADDDDDSESKPSVSVFYLGESFELKREGNKERNKVYVDGKMSYYMNNRQWGLICQMAKICIGKEHGEGSENENKVVFVKGHKYIWQNVVTGEVMEFGEVLEDLVFEDHNNILISDNVWFLPVDLSEHSVENFPKLLNLVGLFFSTRKKTSLILAKSFSIVSAILEISFVRSSICGIINNMFCGSMHYICNKLPFAVRRFVYLSFNWVENLMPRNDIRLKVVRCDYLNVVIGGSAKTNSAQEATLVDWLDEKEEYQFRCGCSIVMSASYDKDGKKCTALMKHTTAGFPEVTQDLVLKCQCQEEFMKIGTFLSCLATSKAGSLFKYDRNDNIVHVRKWRASLRDYVDAGFPVIYKLRLHDVIV